MIPSGHDSFAFSRVNLFVIVSTLSFLLVALEARPAFFMQFFAISECRRIVWLEGQAQGPHPASHPPLVPTGQGDVSGDCPIWLAEFIRRRFSYHYMLFIHDVIMNSVFHMARRTPTRVQDLPRRSPERNPPASLRTGRVPRLESVGFTLDVTHVLIYHEETTFTFSAM